MNHKYPLIAAAIATAAASSGAYAQLTPAGMASAPYQLIIAGSSAASPTVLGIIENDPNLCNGAGNYLQLKSSGDTNFAGVTCNIATQQGSIPAGAQITVYYRSEGGSVVGALPVSSGKSVLRLDPTQCTQVTPYTCTVTGASSINGPNDSWTGAVTEGPVDLGVTDVEPAQLIGLDYPNNYKSSVFGKASPAQLAALVTVPALQQVFGIAVNENGMGFTSQQAINLSKETIANILNGTLSTWNTVPNAATGAPVTPVALPITLINREPGSGTRTATNIYFLQYGCGQTAGIAQSGTVYYATGDELTAANSTNGALAYASINNLQPNSLTYGNLVMAAINGVTPTTLLAAAGEYDFWFEATLVPSQQAVTLNNAGAQGLSNYLQGAIATAATYSVNSDVNFIPGQGGNTASLPPAGATSGSNTSYINVYTRGGNSCNIPSASN
jgi:ABC-type phosphate transport system substrate-binding protein